MSGLDVLFVAVGLLTGGAGLLAVTSRHVLHAALWLVVALGGAATQANPMVDKFSIPGIPSEQAQILQTELFPGTGDALDEASATGVTYKLGSGGMLDGLDEAATGLKAGETATFTSTGVR